MVCAFKNLRPRPIRFGPAPLKLASILFLLRFFFACLSSDLDDIVEKKLEKQKFGQRIFKIIFYLQHFYPSK